MVIYSQAGYDVNFVSWQVIAKARVPIVKFVERISEIPFDIRLYFVF
jgi:DNA polymerase sigma